MKQILVTRENVSVDGEIRLKNFWYKFMIYLIQRIILENEGAIIEQIGEEGFEGLYDLVDRQETYINSIDFTPSKIDGSIFDIGLEIEDFLINKNEMNWKIMGKDCNLKDPSIFEWASNYFETIVFPYLQLVADEIVNVNCEAFTLKTYFISNLEANSVKVYKEIKSDIKELKAKKCISKIIEWSGDNAFYIKNDLVGRIPIDILIIDKSHTQREKQFFVGFPFFKKGDLIRIEFVKKNENWYILAENEDNRLNFRKEIEIC